MRAATELLLAEQVKEIGLVVPCPKVSQSPEVTFALTMPPSTLLLIVYSIEPDVALYATSTLSAEIVGVGVPPVVYVIVTDFT